MRALESLRGLAIGDAFGETFFFPNASLSPDYEPIVPWPWTDDTAMAIALVDVLRTHGHVDQDALALAFAARYVAASPWPAAATWIPLRHGRRHRGGPHRQCRPA